MLLLAAMGNATNAIAVVTNENQVIISPAFGRQFYRLKDL
jgi:hypothetical protein